MWKTVPASQDTPPLQQGPVAQQTSATESAERYFKVQMKAWTSFDPVGKSLAEIAGGIDNGDGFLTVVEVLEVTDNLASVGDEEVREAFANTVAAKRLLRAINSLPSKLKDELRSALNGQPQPATRKAAGSSTESFSAGPPRIKDVGTGR